jgi:hypothetical protein
VASFAQKLLHHGDGGRFAHIIRTALERQPQYAQAFALQGPQCLPNLADKIIALVFVDPAHLVEQTKVVAALARDRAQGFQIFGKARAAVADAWPEKPASDTLIASHAFRHFLNVRAIPLANIGNGVDERDLHCEKRIRCVLDELGTGGTGQDNLRRYPRVVRNRNSSVGHGVAAVEQRLVGLGEHFGAAAAVATENNAVGIQKVGNSSAFAQELRIGGYAKTCRIGSVAVEDARNPFVGAHGNGALHYHEPEAVHRVRDVAAHGVKYRNIGLAVFAGRRAYRDKHHCGIFQSVGQRGREPQAFAFVPGKKFGKKRLVEDGLAALKRRDSGIVAIDRNDVMPDFGKASCCDKPDVARTNDRNAHCS